MNQQEGRFIRLFGNIFFSLMGLVLLVAFVLLGLRMITYGFDRIPWFNFLYMCVLLLMPPVFFFVVFLVFFRRTSRHPAPVVKGISRVLFVAAMLSWSVIAIADQIEFFSTSDPDINRYWCFNLLILFINIALIFFTGVIQALTTEKEKDWMDKHIK